MYAVIYHNEHQFHGPDSAEVFGPFTLDEATAVLDRIRDDLNTNRDEDEGRFQIEQEGDDLPGLWHEDPENNIHGEVYAFVVRLNNQFSA